MLKKLILLFAPIAPPTDAGTKWSEVQMGCEGWRKAKEEALQQWAEARNKHVEEGRGSMERDNLLKLLVEAGMQSRAALVALEKSYRPASGVLGNPDYDVLTSSIYVHPKVMDQLDKVYLKHYRVEGSAPALRRCFWMMGGSDESRDAQKLYLEYLRDVKVVLKALSSSKECKLGVEDKDPHALGVVHSVGKLSPLFGPVFGRLCLPLPTATMIDDMKECMDVADEIMGEVMGHNSLSRTPT